VVRNAAFAVPGDLAIPTGGYVYDRRIIAELSLRDWRIEVVDLGDGFPYPAAATRAAACARLAALRPGDPVVIDGLAFGVLAEAAAALRASHPLVALACARHVIATSAAVARLLVDDYGVAAGRVSVVEPGTDRVLPPPRKREGEVKLLAVGSVIPRKGYDVLVAALARLRHLPWRLIIAGDRGRSPQTSRRLRAEIARLGLADRITLLGAVTPGELSPLYACTDLFVLPSRFEGYGMAYTEAIAHGVPVIGTTAGAVPQTVPAEAGVLVAPDDVEALTATLQRLIANPHERERLAAGARAAKFPSWSEQAALFARVLESLA